MAKKKNLSGQVQDAYNGYASEVQNAGDNVVAGVTAAGQQQIADLDAANKAWETANADAAKAYQAESQAGYKDFADMVQSYADNLRQAEAESAAQVAADQKAARWTGAAELAASIANLVSVGGYNAVSQQYKPFSQDWMRKADQDARLNRARIDNLRERQRAMQSQLASLRIGEAGKALQMARENANARHQQSLASAQARYNATVNPLTEAAKTADAVGKINAQGATQAANVGIHERQLAQQAAYQKAQQDETRRYHDEQIRVAEMKAQSKAGSGDKGLPILIKMDGRDVTLNVPEKAYQTALERGAPDLKEDILAMAKEQGFQGQTWEDLKAAAMRASGSKKERKRAGEGEIYDGDLVGIINILAKQPDEYEEGDEKKLKKFLEGNYDKTLKFNEHLYKVSKGALPWANEEDRREEPKENKDEEKKEDKTGLGNYS